MRWIALPPGKAQAGLISLIPSGRNSAACAKLGTTVVDEVRRRAQHETTGHRGRKDDPLQGIERLLRAGGISPTGEPLNGCREHPQNVLSGNPNGRLKVGHDGPRRAKATDR